jgi:ribosomal protein S18 acetylase RimI-like enzyme
VKVTIRALTPEDIPAAVRVWQETTARAKDVDPPDAVRRYLDRNPGVCQVADQDGTLIGLTVAGHDGRRGFLHHVGVSGAYRRQGVGRKLVECTLAALRHAGLTRVHVQLKQGNAIGLHFWKRLGCRERTDAVVISILLSDSGEGS